MFLAVSVKEEKKKASRRRRLAIDPSPQKDQRRLVSKNQVRDKLEGCVIDVLDDIEGRSVLHGGEGDAGAMATLQKLMEEGKRQQHCDAALFSLSLFPLHQLA